MLKDITIGQYFPGESTVHRLDARVKLIITMLFIVMLFSADGVFSLSAGVIFLIMAYTLTELSPSLITKSLKPVVPVLLITALINIFFFEGNEIFRLGFISVTDGGLINSAFMLVRVTALIVGSSVLTYTTSPIELTNAIEKLLAPLRIFKFPVHELAMMMTIALRFIPTFIEETDKIISAQKARGADFETGSLKERAGAVVPVLVPLFISAFRRAEELALAMECRCYRGGEGRTRMKQMKIRTADTVALVITFVFLACVFAIDRMN
ncbi:energy-coupling factor transporter transmembrane component T [Ruminococcus sp. HUN007]|uniref:energy-coupling factor transporter transmembrane component T family protein n=1 Tax=Ruminococcus sp. HUN007 TaxID=1514668 RepID=UPI0005D2CD77|nr:energy-coupling factor transporter transmembrane component T [Ruminococcus sp. HUN007]